MAELDLVSTLEAAEILDVSSPTVKRLVHRGQLTPASKMPGATGAFVFERREVERLRDERAEAEAAKAAEVKAS